MDIKLKDNNLKNTVDKLVSALSGSDRARFCELLADNEDKLCFILEDVDRITKNSIEYRDLCSLKADPFSLKRNKLVGDRLSALISSLIREGRLDYEYSRRKYSPRMINVSSLSYYLKNPDKHDKEYAESKEQDMSVLIDRYRDLRRISGIWNKETPKDVDPWNDPKKGSYYLTLPERKQYVYSFVLFDNGVIGEKVAAPYLGGWNDICNTLNVKLNGRNYPWAFYRSEEKDNISDSRKYMQDMGVAEDIWTFPMGIEMEAGPEGELQAINRREMIEAWICNTSVINGAGNKNGYPLNDREGLEAYLAVYNAAKEKGQGAVDMFKDELFYLTQHISFSVCPGHEGNVFCYLPVDVLSADEAVLQLMYVTPFRGLDTYQAERLIKAMMSDIQRYSNLLDVGERLGFSVDEINMIPAVKVWLNDNMRNGEALKECIEKGYISNKIKEQTTTEMLQNWYNTGEIKYLPEAYHLSRIVLK